MPPIKEWVRGAKIGHGEYATVFEAHTKVNSKPFAVKSTDRNDLEKRLALEKERKALKACKSKYIVRYLGCSTSDKVEKMKKMHTFDLFMELVPRGTVLDHWNRNGNKLEEPIVAAYTRDVLHGLDYLHANGIVHGDIKCANLLVGPRNLILCDLGSAKFLKDGDFVLAPRPGDHNHARIFVTGTYGWMAPEVEDEIEQSTHADVYSLGCAVVEMCTGHPPQKVPVIYAFENFPDDQDDDNFPQCTVDVPPNYSEQCREFVDMCLALDPQDRPTVTELLKHPWILKAPPYPQQKPPVRKKSSIVSFYNTLFKNCSRGPSKGCNCGSQIIPHPP